MISRDPSAEVAMLVRQTLALPESESISEEQLFFYDLGFTSMDLLDLLFRIEQHFQITIPEGTIYQLARGDLTETKFAEDAVLTEAGRLRLMGLLYDTPKELFPERIHATTLPRFCTVGAIVRLVDHKLAEQQTCSS